MNDSLMQEILKRLDALAAKLGEGAAYTWATYVRQAFWVQGILSLVLAVLFFLASGLLLKTCLWSVRKGERTAEEAAQQPRNWDEPYTTRSGNDWYTLAWWTGFASAAALVAGVVFIWGSIAHIINPQYYALQELAKMLTGK